jgi:hypothetical protein
MPDNESPSTSPVSSSAADSKLENLLNEIKEAVADFKELRIVTVVGTTQGNNVKDLDFSFTGETKTILTRIDLLDGDTSTIIDEAFMTGDFETLRDFHARREENAYTIVRTNIAALRELFSLATSLLEGGE